MQYATKVLGTLGDQAEIYFLTERLQQDETLDVKFQALEAVSELDRPRTARALREILRIFKND